MDLFRELEKAVRTPARSLLIDQLLPPPEQIPSSLPDDTTSHLPPGAGGKAADAGAEEGFGMGNLRETLEKMEFPDDPEPAADPADGDLQDEIRQFLALQKDRGVHGAPDPEPEPASPPETPEPPPSSDPES